MPIVFVYGSLKKDFPNQALNHGERIGLDSSYATAEKYPLYLVGERYSPWLINSVNHGYRVKGELYRVDQAGLTIMDRLERTEHTDGYKRLKLVICELNSSILQDAFVYLKPENLVGSANLRLGPLDCYNLEHAALYKPGTG